MVGAVPSRNKTTMRKQWTLHDGPRGSLRRLRNQLASDGCPESQVVLAKQLFEEECELDIDKQENARLAVYWLIKASEQGNSEATNLLSNCLSTGKGITEHNYLDVKSCINMTQEEKIARKAAREMFASLSNGEDFITSEQLQKRMLEIQSQFYNRKIQAHDHSNQLENGELVNNIGLESNEAMDWSNRDDSRNEKLTEDHLVTAAVNYSHGYLPLVNRVLSLTDPNLHALDHVPYLQRSILHPFLAIRIIYYKLIRSLGNRGCFSNYLPTNRTDCQLLLLLFYLLFSAETITLFIPTVLFYGSFVAMVLLTFQMLQSSRDFHDFQVWSGLFLTYSSGHLNAEQAEFQFIRNNLKPYGHFFVALLVNFVVYPFIAAGQWIPQSEITILSFCLTFMTLLSSTKERRSSDILLLFSFAVNVIAKYPYEVDPVVTQSWRFLDLKIPTFATYIIGQGIEFCLNFRLVLYIIIPVLFVYISSRQNWRGTYTYFIPHCVTLSWLQVVVIHAQGATMFGLLRGTLALVGIVLFLPLIGITTILLPAFAVTRCFFTQNNNLLLSCAFFISFAIIGITFCFYVLSRTRFSKYLGLVQIIIGILAIWMLVNSTLTNKSNIDLFTKQLLPSDDHSNLYISWDQYQSICHQPAWDQTSNIAQTQLFCHRLGNFPIINWNGYINEIKLKRIENNWKYYIDKLPILLRNYLYCYYGNDVDNNFQQTNEQQHYDYLFMNNVIKSKNKCSLDHLNIYEYEISVRMQSGIWGKSAEIILIAEHAFTNFTVQLKTNDKIWFNGFLVNVNGDGYLGGPKPHISLKDIGCLACHNLNLTKFKLTTKNETDFVNILLDMLYKGCKFVLNILFNPIFVIK